VRGLGDVLVRTGAIQEIAQFEDFMRGFTRGKTLFDFIDVGAGKDRADEKIIGKYTLGHLANLFRAVLLPVLSAKASSPY
jgi:hypothetical protein